MATVVDDALHADEADAGDAEVAHQLFGVRLAKIRIFHHLVVLARILKCQVVLGQLLGLEGLLESGLAEGAESEALLLNLDETHLAKGVPAVQVTRHTCLSVEVLVTRRALHLITILAFLLIINLKLS